MRQGEPQSDREAGGDPTHYLGKDVPAAGFGKAAGFDGWLPPVAPD
jgi:hypothetical protein